jgi:hypothetical protein
MCLDTSAEQRASSYETFCSSQVKCTHDRDGGVKLITIRSGAEPGKERKAAKFETPLLEADRAAIVSIGSSWCAARSIELVGDKGEGELQFYLRGILRGYISVEPRELLHVDAFVDELVPVNASTLLAASKAAGQGSTHQLIAAMDSLTAMEKECLVLKQESQIQNYRLGVLQAQQSNEVTRATPIRTAC